MKKLFPTLILISFLAALLIPIIASAVEMGPVKECKMKREIKIGDLQCANEATYQIEGPDAMCCIMNTMYSITDWIFVFLVGLAGIFVIVGAMILLMAAGAPEKVTSGRNYIMYAALGLIVGLLAKAIPGLVRMIAGI